MGAADLAAAGTAARSRRAALKRRIKEGLVDVAGLLDGEDEQAETIALDMRVSDLVRAVDGFGHETTLRLLSAAVIEYDQRLASLTIRRRRQLADAIRKEIAA